MLDRTASNTQDLSQNSTTRLKQKLLQLTEGNDFQPLEQKVQFYQEKLEPIVAELSQRNPNILEN